jgi:gas vesicle protein
MNNVSILCALGSGVAIGVAIGILIAPEKGSETRHRIMNFVKNEKKMLQEQLHEFLQSKGMDFSPEEVSEILRNHEKHS